MRFEETNLNDNIKRAVKDMGYIDLTPIQESTYEYVAEGKNIVAMSNTGSGKTAAFMLPLINNIKVEEKNTQILVVTPTRELAIQIVQETRKYCKYIHSINCLAIYGGQEIKQQAILLRKGVKIVVGTPGRLLDLLKKKVLKLSNLKVIVLDEADEMLDMGFYDDVYKIISSVNSSVQKLLFSATITNRVKDISQKLFKDSIYVESKDNKTMLVDNVRQIAIEVKEKMKSECVLRILNKVRPKNSIVFCNTKKATLQVGKYLSENGISLEILNSDIEQHEREKIFKRLKNGELDTIVVTDVLSRGIDVKDLELVINYDIPLENEYYIHRIGRTARMGKSGISYTLYIGKQIEKIKELESYTNTKFEFENIPVKLKSEVSYNFPTSKNDNYIVTLTVGKKDNIKAKDIVGAMAANVGINSQVLGIVDVKDETTDVEIPKEYIADVVEKFRNGKIKGKDVKIANI